MSFIIIGVDLSTFSIDPFPAEQFMYYTPPSVLSNINLHDSNYMYKHVFTGRVGNSVDPDQLASEKPADLDLHCFKTGYIRDKRVKG